MKISIAFLFAGFATAEQCAIPLRNLTPPSVPRMPTFKPPSADTRMAVPPPMPACAAQPKTPIAAWKDNFLRNRKWRPNELLNPNWKSKPLIEPYRELEEIPKP